MIEDVQSDPRHAKDVAERTGYVPKGLMAVPVLHEERALGVLQVLDRQTTFSLGEMDLLGMFANQAAIALDLLLRARTTKSVLDGADADVAAASRGWPPRSTGSRESAAPRRSRSCGALEDLMK